MRLFTQLSELCANAVQPHCESTFFGGALALCELDGGLRHRALPHAHRVELTGDAVMGSSMVEALSQGPQTAIGAPLALNRRSVGSAKRSAVNRGELMDLRVNRPERPWPFGGLVVCTVRLAVAPRLAPSSIAPPAHSSGHRSRARCRGCGLLAATKRERFPSR